MSRFKGWTEESVIKLKMKESKPEIKKIMSNKYRNKRIHYNNVPYDSKLEAKEAKELDLKVKLGLITHWERQVRTPLEVYGFLICTYVVDFIAYHKDGRKEYIEVKGYQTRDSKIKMKLFEIITKRNEPDSIITIVRK
ncbi:MAG: DUF1064 domain-containing protein [Candidatus Kapaibacterium sp.]